MTAAAAAAVLSLWLTVSVGLLRGQTTTLDHENSVNVPSWCVLICHFRPNHNHHPDAGQLAIQDVPAHMCTHLVYESAVVAADMKVNARNAELEVYHSGPRLFARLNNMKQRYASLVTLIGVDLPADQQFQDSLSFFRHRTALVDSMVAFAADNNFDGVVLNLPDVDQLTSGYIQLAKELHRRRAGQSFLKTSRLSWIVASIPRRRAVRNAHTLAAIGRYLDMVVVASDENTATYAAYVVDPVKRPSTASADNSMESAVEALQQAGMQISNIVMGLSLRPHLFTLRESSYQQVGSPSTVDSPRLTTYSKICDFNLRAEVDSRCVAKYGVMSPGRWVSLNDVEMVARKVEWLEEHGFRGLSLSPINADDSQGVCHPREGPFPLLRAAFDNLHCLDMSMPMYEEVALPEEQQFYEDLDSVPCVRMCSVDHTRLRPDIDLSPALHGGCTHLVVGNGSFGRDGSLVVDEPLKQVIRTWKLVKSKMTALLMTIDGDSLTAVEHYADEADWLQRTEKAMNLLGLEGISVALNLRDGHLPIGVDHRIERLSAKLHKLRNYGNGLKKLLIISTTVDTLYARQIDWVRLSKFADFLSVSGSTNMMLGDDFNQILRDYYIDRHKLLLGVDAPVASRMYSYEEPSTADDNQDRCRRFVEHGAWGTAPSHDTITSVKRKARFATMKNFAGVSLSNLESDDPNGECHLGSKFPMLHTVLNNQLCDQSCQDASKRSNCHPDWRVQCYYEAEADGVRKSRFEKKDHFRRCTHLTVLGFQLVRSFVGGGHLTLQTPVAVREVNDDLQAVRSYANVSLIAAVRSSEKPEVLDTLLRDPANRNRLIDEILVTLQTLDYDGIEFQTGELFTLNRHSNLLALFRVLRERLIQRSSGRSRSYEMSYATDSGLSPTIDRSFIEEINNLFSCVTLLSFKYGMPEPLRPDVINQLSIDDVINGVVGAGLSKNKILLALPLFGTHYELLPNVKSPLDSDQEFRLHDNLKFYNATGYRTMRQLCTTIVQKRMRKSICLDSIISYAFNNNELLVHESPETMLLKTRYARVKQLRGIALYTLNMDDRGVVCTGEPYPMLFAATLDSKVKK